MNAETAMSTKLRDAFPEAFAENDVLVAARHWRALELGGVEVGSVAWHSWLDILRDAIDRLGSERAS